MLTSMHFKKTPSQCPLNSLELESSTCLSCLAKFSRICKPFFFARKLYSSAVLFTYIFRVKLRIMTSMTSVRFTLILALISFMIGKVWYSWYFFRHCIATDEVIFDNQNFVDNFIKKNQTLLDAIEDDCNFYLYRLNQRKYLSSEYEAQFKQEYKKYLNTYEEILQKYQDVFYYGYFTIIADKDGPVILQLLWDLHTNRTEVLSMSFKDKRPFDVVVENKRMQDTIGIILLTNVVH